MTCASVSLQKVPPPPPPRHEQPPVQGPLLLPETATVLASQGSGVSSSVPVASVAHEIGFSNGCSAQPLADAAAPVLQQDRKRSPRPRPRRAPVSNQVAPVTAAPVGTTPSDQHDSYPPTVIANSQPPSACRTSPGHVSFLLPGTPGSEMPENFRHSLRQLTGVSHSAPSTTADAPATFADRRASDSAYIYAGTSASLAPVQKLQLACPPRNHATLIHMRLRTGESTATGGSDCPSSRASISPRHSTGGRDCLPEASLEDTPEGPAPRVDARVWAMDEPHSHAQAAALAVLRGAASPGDTPSSSSTTAAPPAPQSPGTITGWYLEWARSHPPLPPPASRLRRDIAEQPALLVAPPTTDYSSLRITGHSFSAVPAAGLGCSRAPNDPGTAFLLPLPPQAHQSASFSAALGSTKRVQTAVPLAVQERTAITDAARQRDQQHRILPAPLYVELDPLAAKPAALGPGPSCLMAERPALALATITVLLRRLLVADSAATTGAEGVADDGIAAALRLVSRNLGFAHGASPPGSTSATGGMRHNALHRGSPLQPKLPQAPPVARPSFLQHGSGSGYPRAPWDATTSISPIMKAGELYDPPAFLHADAAEAPRQQGLEHQRPWADSRWQRRGGAVETEACGSGATSMVQRPRVHFDTPGTDVNSGRRPVPPVTGLEQLWIHTASPVSPVMSPLLFRERRAVADAWTTASESQALQADKPGRSHSALSQRSSPLVLPLRRHAAGEADRPVIAASSALLAPDHRRALAAAPSARSTASAVCLATEVTVREAAPISAAGSIARGGTGADSAASACLMRDVRGLDVLLEQEEQDAAMEAAEGHGVAIGSPLELSRGRASPLFHVQRLDASRRRATAGARAAAAAVAAANVAIEGARRQRAASRQNADGAGAAW